MTRLQTLQTQTHNNQLLDSCASQTSCTNCTSVSLCHWCESDKKCHLYGSPYGCTIGATCTDLQCQRTEPEFLAYGSANTKAITGVITIGLLILFSMLFIMFILYYYYEKRRRKIWLKQQQQLNSNDDTEYIQLSHVPDIRDTLGNNTTTNSSSTTVTISTNHRTPREIQREKRAELYRTPEMKQILDEKQQHLLTNTNEILTEHKQPTIQRKLSIPSDKQVSVVLNEQGKPTLKVIPAVATTEQRPTFSASYLKPCCTFLFVLLTVGVAISAFLAILMIPRLPEYSLCSKEIEYSSIFKNLVTTGNPTARIDMLFSLWNPNHFELDLQQVDVRILYQHGVVAKGSITDLSFPPGSVSDFILLTDFFPSLTTAWSMYNAHKAKQLLLDVVLDLKSTVLVRGNQLLNVNTSYVVSSVDAEGPDDFKYCKCKQ